MNKLYLALISISIGLSGCDHFKHDVQSLQSSYQKSASDTIIYTNVVQVLQNMRRDLPADVRLIVLGGRVLVVGYVATSQEHVNIVNAIWQIKGVQEVLDHLEYVDKNQRSGFDLKSAFLKTQLDTLFLANSALRYGCFQYVIFKRNLYALAYKISESEKDAFFKMVRRMPNLQKVFFYNTHRH